MVALALAVLVLQTHAIQGWTMALTGQWPGWGWALLTAPADGWALALLPEVANLLAWWRAARTRGWARGGWSALAVLALALVVAAPLYTITAPALDSLAGAHAVRGADPVVDTLDATVRALAADWRTRPQAAELARELRAEAARAREDATRTAQPWRAQAVLAAELAVVLLAALVTAAASWFLAGAALPIAPRKPETAQETRAETVPETRKPPAPAPETGGVLIQPVTAWPDPPPDDDYYLLQTAMQDLAQRNGWSQSTLTERLQTVRPGGISKKTVSAIMQGVRRPDGTPPLSPEAIRSISAAIQSLEA